MPEPTPSAACRTEWKRRCDEAGVPLPSFYIEHLELFDEVFARALDAERAKTSQGGKPYNLEFIRGLEERIARLTEERDRLRDEVGRLREAGDNLRRVFLRHVYGNGVTMDQQVKHPSLQKALATWDAALAPAEGTEGT